MCIRDSFYTTPPQAIPTRVLPGGAAVKPPADDSQEQPTSKKSVQ